MRLESLDALKNCTSGPCVYMPCLWKANVHAKHGRGANAKPFFFDNGILVFLNFAWRACSAFAPLPAGRNWVTINGAIVEVTGLLQFVSGLRRQIGGKKGKVGVEILLHIVSGLERQSHGNLRLSPTLTAEAPEIKYLWCSLSSCAYKTTRVCVRVEDSGRCAAASKASFRVAGLPFALMLTVCAPVCSAAHEAKGQQRFGSRCWLGETSSFSR